MKYEMETKWKRTIYIISIISTILYLIYRLFFTIPNDTILNIIIGIMVLSIECIDAFFFGVYVFNILFFRKENPELPILRNRNYPDVDIFIATINEEEKLLTETILACKNMKYPDSKKIHIYLCDDGNRESIKKLAHSLSIEYLTREEHIDAKAGNYNHALTKTKSPFIATFDADMRPNPDFLLRTIPFLVKNKKVGFVQLPQNFSNYDLFQSRYHLFHKIPFEQDYFYHQIQLAKNQTNSVIYCGTNTVLSRKALEDSGGFATKTITEDIATGMMIEANGYQGIALNHDEVFGRNVTNVESLLKQRSRWSRGCIQIFKNYPILRNKKLTKRQKFDYLSAIYYWTFGIRNIFYLTIPLLFSFFNIRVIRSHILTFLIIFFIQYLFKRVVIDVAEKNLSSSTWNHIYELILTPIISFEVMKEIFGFGNLKFEVTAKDETKMKKEYRKYYTYFVHLLFFLLTLSGITISFYKVYYYHYNEFSISLFWLLSNFLYLGISLIFDCSNRKKKEYPIKKTSHYSIVSIPLVLFEYFKNQIRWIESICLIFLLLFSFQFIQYTNKIQYPKGYFNRVTYNQELKIEDGKLVNYKGENLQLRGLSTHNLFYFKDQYTYYNLDILVHDWGINVFRIAVYTNPDEEGYVKNPDLYQELEKLIDYCIDLDIYVIVDWHILEDNNPNTYLEQSMEFFDKLSEEYGDYPNILYEICNEPNGDDVTWNDSIKPYAEKVISVIRENDEDGIVLVGTANWSKDLESVRYNLIDDEYTMYVGHIYPNSNPEIVMSAIENTIREKIPVMITECSPAEISNRIILKKNFFQQIINSLEEKHISWIVWQLSNKNEATSILSYKSKENVKKENFKLNNNLSKTGKIVKEVFDQYTKEKRA